ncbi:MAG: cytochrome c [Conexibacteraceae bacterium]|nr:cytochrome c [Conexibacteraceae bacterium]
MVGVIIIAVVFTGLALAVAYGASKGTFKGLGDALQTTSRAGSRLLNTSIAFVFIAFGVATPLIFILGNHSNSNAKAAGLPLNAAEQSGRELFGAHCAVCHTLSADNAVGKVGPNLDVLKPPEAIVAHTIENGCLQKPVGTNYSNVCLGFGTMPAGLLQGRQVTDVAAFVARVAGH